MAAKNFTNSFSAISTNSNPFSRRWGSNNTSNAVDPYITGYHFIKFKHFPSLTEIVGEGGVSLTNEQCRNTLESSVTSVTIPGATLNKAEFSGLGGVKWFYPTNADWDNTITLKFTEWSGAPVHTIVHSWIKMLCDYRGGIMRTAGSSDGRTPTKSDFTASMYYFTTRPDGLTVDYHCLATGMFPTKDPTDLFGHDLTAIDKLELDIDFSLDYLWHEDFTFQACQDIAKTYYGLFSGTIAQYGSSADSNTVTGTSPMAVNSAS